MEKLGHKLIELALANGADSADVIMSESTGIQTTIRHDKLEDLERAETCGLGLRVFVGNKQGSASGSDLRSESLSQIAERAVSIAKLAPIDPFCGLPNKKELANIILDLELDDHEEPEVSWLIEQAKNAEETALSHQGITNSEGGSASFNKSRLTILSSDGFEGSYAQTSFNISASVLVGEGNNMQRDYAYHVSRYRNQLKSGIEIGNEAATRALKKLNPVKKQTTRVPVIFDKRVARGLIGNFLSAISGSAIARGTSFLKDKQGKLIFPAHLSIIDDPHVMKGLASRPFDAEGCANHAMDLISNGMLQTWLLDSRSARQLGMQSNHRAARGLSSGTHPSSTNVRVEGGMLSFESLFADVNDGFYVTETFGMGINLITGDYSQGASGFWIEKGQIAYPVSEITIAGNLNDMFLNLSAANDATFDYAINSPTLRVEQMTIAGN